MMTSGQVGGLSCSHFSYEALIERVAHESDATSLTHTVLNNVDKKHTSSLSYVLGLTTTDESKSLKIMRNVAVGEGAIALLKFLAEYQPDIVNRHLGLDDDNELDDSRDRSDHCNQ